MKPNYVSESFWGANTILTLLMVLLMIVTMCIPAIVAYRYQDKKQMWISLLCGLVSMVIWLPWIVSVVMASKKYDMPKKKESVISPGIYTLCSIVLIGVGGAIMYRDYSTWSTLGVLFGISLLLWGVAFFGGESFGR